MCFFLLSLAHISSPKAICSNMTLVTHGCCYHLSLLPDYHRSPVAHWVPAVETRLGWRFFNPGTDAATAVVSLCSDAQLQKLTVLCCVVFTERLRCRERDLSNVCLYMYNLTVTFVGWHTGKKASTRKVLLFPHPLTVKLKTEKYTKAQLLNSIFMSVIDP